MYYTISLLTDWQLWIIVIDVVSVSPLVWKIYSLSDAVPGFKFDQLKFRSDPFNALAPLLYYCNISMAKPVAVSMINLKFCCYWY